MVKQLSVKAAESMTKTVLGGKQSVRSIDKDEPFEVACLELFGARMQNKAFARSFWSSLANVVWKHDETQHTISYSFRAAGDFICAIRGEGNYMDWYCSGPVSQVDDEIAKALAQRGWCFLLD